jgi:serine/threonine-protein kinase
MPPPVVIARPEANNPVGPVPVVEPGVIRTVEEFREAINRPVPGLKTLTLVADADWVVPAIRLRGMSNLVIRADRGSGRPRLRFRGDPVPPLGAFFPAMADSLPEPWNAWITLQSGWLRLEGIDLVLPEVEKVGRRRAAFAIAPGSNDLSLIDCSVTIQGDASPSAVVALLAGEPSGDVRVRIKDGLIRSGGDLVDVAGGRRLDLDLDNAVVALGGTMVHGHGLPEGRTVEPIKLDLRQITSRLAGGLIHLQSAAGEPELPIAEIKARDSIFTTGDPDAPLLRVDGQGDTEDLKDAIHWEGRSVAYHQINFYRRDQSARPGAGPKQYNREFWNFKLSRLEELPIHGDLKFLDEDALAGSPWTLRPDDVRLAPGSPASGVGADLQHVPSPALR